MASCWFCANGLLIFRQFEEVSHATCCDVTGCINGYVLADCQFGFGRLAMWVLRRFLLCNGLLQAGGRLLLGPMLPSDALLPLGLLQARLL